MHVLLHLLMADELAAERQAIEDAVRAYETKLAQVNGEHSGPTVVQAWVVAVEFTSMELLDRDLAGRDVIRPTSQLISTSRGLAGYAEDRFA